MTETKIASIVCRALLQGLALRALDVHATILPGSDLAQVIDWKWETTDTTSILDAAQLFIRLVGNRHAVRACRNSGFRQMVKMDAHVRARKTFIRIVIDRWFTRGLQETLSRARHVDREERYELAVGCVIEALASFQWPKEWHIKPTGEPYLEFPRAVIDGILRETVRHLDRHVKNKTKSY